MGERNRMTDEKLIRQYVREGSEDAFRQIVERYLKVVYATCLREVHNPEMAQDVTQIVFVLLAQKARRLRRGTVLSGWLYTTARFASRVALRNETRRRHYEMRAVEQMPNYEDREEHGAAGEVIEPWLNEALSRLAPKDREVLLLRYAEEHSMREIGERCGISEHSAHMRVTRALEKLRRGLRMRGIDAPESAALTIALPLLLTGSSLTVPSSVSAAAISHAVSSILAGTAGAAATGARLSQLSQGVQQAMRLQQMKIAGIVLAGCLGVGFGTGKITHSGALSVARTTLSSGTVPAAKAASATRYTITDLGIPAGFDAIRARAINNKGEIVGDVSFGARGKSSPFYYHDGSLHIIDSPPCAAIAINDQGTILGRSVSLSPKEFSFSALIGTKDQLKWYMPPVAHKFLSLTGINNKGVISGWYTEENNNGNVEGSTNFLLSGGKRQPIPIPTNTRVAGINNNAELFGNTAGIRMGFVYSGGTITMLPSQPGWAIIASAMNDHGDITGYTRNQKTSENMAFLSHNGSVTSLGTATGFTTSMGMAINNAGVVVGYVSTPQDENRGFDHAAIFNSGRAVLLNTLVSGGEGWNLIGATGINDHGQIIGDGVHNGAQRAFLLTPKS